MTYPAHIALGYITASILSNTISNSFSSTQENLLFFVCIFAAIVPDIDFFPFFVKHKAIKLQKNDSHRKYITHTPVFWIVVSIIIYSIGIATDKIYLIYTSIYFIFGVLSHLIADSIEYGIMWLWPFSKKQLYLHRAYEEEIDSAKPIKYYWNFFRKNYIKNWTFYIELVVIFYACYSLLA